MPSGSTTFLFGVPSPGERARP